jgi:hypothetical protein
MAGRARPSTLLPCCDATAAVLFTIHVREKAVACAVARDVLDGSGSAGIRAGAGLARFESLRATIALLSRDAPAHE